MKTETKNSIVMTVALLTCTSILYFVILFFLAGCQEPVESESIACGHHLYCGDPEPNERGYYIAHLCTFDTEHLDDIWLNTPCVEDDNVCGGGGDDYTCYTDTLCYEEPCTFGEQRCLEGGSEQVCTEGNLCIEPYWAFTGRKCW